MRICPGSLAAERAAIEEEFRRLAEEHEQLERHDSPFDWPGHVEHRAKLCALRQRISEYRIRVMHARPDTKIP